MKKTAGRLLRVTGWVLLGTALVYVIWEPVIPSGWIVREMANRIDPDRVPPGEERVVRFELSGKGGGTYSMVVRNEGVEVVARDTDRVDLVLFMEAEEFNALVLALARGTADASTIIRLVIANVLRFAGDMDVFQELFRQEGGSR